jgi:hypothetical protein
MKTPSMLKPAILGAMGGAAALAIIGFTWGGWVSQSRALEISDERSSTAVVEALTPICVAAYRKDANAQTQRMALSKASSWERGDFVAKAGWAEIPGMKTVNMPMARACAEIIVGEKL